MDWGNVAEWATVCVTGGGVWAAALAYRAQVRAQLLNGAGQVVIVDCHPLEPQPGQAGLQYEITIRNSGPSPARDVLIALYSYGDTEHDKVALLVSHEEVTVRTREMRVKGQPGTYVCVIYRDVAGYYWERSENGVLRPPLTRAFGTPHMGYRAYLMRKKYVPIRVRKWFRVRWWRLGWRRRMTLRAPTFFELEYGLTLSAQQLNGRPRFLRRRRRGWQVLGWPD